MMYLCVSSVVPLTYQGSIECACVAKEQIDTTSCISPSPKSNSASSEDPSLSETGVLSSSRLTIESVSERDSTLESGDGNLMFDLVS